MTKKKSSKKTRQTANRIAASKSGAPSKQRAGKAGGVLASGENEAFRTGDYETVSGDHETATGDHEVATGDHEVASGDHETASGDHEVATGDHDETVSEDRGTVSGDHEALGDRGTITGDHDAISGDQGTITGDHEAFSSDQGTITGDHEAISSDQGTITGDHETLTSDETPPAEPGPTSQPHAATEPDEPVLSAAREEPSQVPFSWTRPQDYFGVSASKTFQGMPAAIPGASTPPTEDITPKKAESGGAFAKIKSKLASRQVETPLLDRQEPLPEPVAEPVTEPVEAVERVVEPVIEPVETVERVAEPVTEPVEAVERVAELVIEPAEPVADPVRDPVAMYEQESGGALGSLVPESTPQAESNPSVQADLRPITPKLAKYIANLKDSIVAQRQAAEPSAQQKNFDWKQAEALLKGMAEPKAEAPPQPEFKPPAPKSAVEPIGNKPPLQFPLAEDNQLRPRFQRTVDASKILEKSSALSSPPQPQPAAQQPTAPQTLPALPKPTAPQTPALPKPTTPQPQPTKAEWKSESFEEDKSEEPDDSNHQKKKSVQDLRESIISQGEGTADEWHPVEKAKKKAPKDFVPAIEALQKLPPDFGLEKNPKVVKIEIPKVHHSLEELAAMDPSLALPPPTNQQQSMRRLKSTATAGIRLDFIVLVLVVCWTIGFGCQLLTPKTFIEPGRTIKAAVQSIMPMPLYDTFNKGIKLFDEQSLKAHQPTTKASATLRMIMAPPFALLYIVQHIWNTATEKADPLSKVMVSLEFLSLFLLAYLCYVKLRRRATYGVFEYLWLPIPLIIFATLISVPTSYMFECLERFLFVKLMPDTIVFFTTLTFAICVFDAVRRSFFVRAPALDPRD